jgi:cobalamin biosynthesis Mg chelatase CobN
MKNPSGIPQDSSMQTMPMQKPGKEISTHISNNQFELEATTSRDKEVTATAVWDKAKARYDLDGAVNSQQQNPRLFSAIISQILPLEKEAFWNHHQLDLPICRLRLTRLPARSLSSDCHLSCRGPGRMDQQVLGIPPHHRTADPLARLSGHMYRETTRSHQTKKSSAGKNKRLSR